MFNNINEKKSMNFRTKEEAINALNDFKSKFNISDREFEDMFDDGCDYGDAKQNRRYCAVESKVNRLHNEIANYEFDCIPESICKNLWVKAWGKGSTHLPENKWSHAIKYADLLIERLSIDVKEIYVVNIYTKDFFAPLQESDIQGALTGEADKLWSWNRGKNEEDMRPVFSVPSYIEYYDCHYCGIEPVKDNRFALLEWKNEYCGTQFYNVCKCYKEKPTSLKDAVKEWSRKFYDSMKGSKTYRFVLAEYEYK